MSADSVMQFFEWDTQRSTYLENAVTIYYKRQAVPADSENGNVFSLPLSCHLCLVLKGEM